MKINSKGYIAMTSVIIITALLLTVVIALNARGYFGRGIILDSQLKKISRAYAESCVDYAILRYTENPLYTGGETINLQPGSCMIRTLAQIDANTIKIESTASFQDTYTNLRVLVTVPARIIIDWQELASF